MRIVGADLDNRVVLYDDGYRVPIVSMHGIHGESVLDPDFVVSFVAFDPRSQSFTCGHTSLYDLATVH